MKSKFRKIIVFPILLAILSSCSLKTHKSERLFLYSTFTLNHAYEYEERFLNLHTFIPVSEATSRDSLFDKNKNIAKFYPLNGDKNPEFDLDFTLKGNETMAIEKVQYLLKINSNDEMTIELKSSIENLLFHEIYVFPNYWLRIHYETMIDNVNYNLILEYRNTGKTVIPEK